MDIKEALKVVVENGHVVCDGAIELYFYPDDNKFVISSYSEKFQGFVTENYDEVEDAINSYIRNTNGKNIRS